MSNDFWFDVGMVLFYASAAGSLLCVIIGAVILFLDMGE